MVNDIAPLENLNLVEILDLDGNGIISKDEMNKKVNQIKKDLFNMRFKRSNGPDEDTSKFSLLRKDLAKILTKMNKKN